MTEAEFAEQHYDLIRRIARRKWRTNHEDLAQIGIIAALKCFRQQQPGPPSTALVACAAKRAIVQYIRSETCGRRGGEFERANPAEITGETRAEERRIERIDLERALALLETPEEREVFRQTLAGRTLEEIAKSIHRNAQHVCRVKSHALDRIRRALYLTA